VLPVPVLEQGKEPESVLEPEPVLELVPEPELELELELVQVPEPALVRHRRQR